MNNVKLLIAGSAFFAMSAQAADRVSEPPRESWRLNFLRKR